MDWGGGSDLHDDDDTDDDELDGSPLFLLVAGALFAVLLGAFVGTLVGAPDLPLSHYATSPVPELPTR